MNTRRGIAAARNYVCLTVVYIYAIATIGIVDSCFRNIILIKSRPRKLCAGGFEFMPYTTNYFIEKSLSISLCPSATNVPVEAASSSV